VDFSFLCSAGMRDTLHAARKRSSVAVRCARTACLGLLLTSGCTRARTPVVLSERVAITVAGSPLELIVRVHPEHAADRERFARAAAVTLRSFGDWFGPLPYRTLTVVDPAWHSTTPVEAEAIVLDRTPWWHARTAMTPELAAARGLSRRVWHDALGAGTLPSWFVEGLAEYTARRVVAPLFESENNPPGYAFLEERYFGGFVPRFVRIRLRAEVDGDPVPAYRAHPLVRVLAAPDTGAGTSAGTSAGTNAGTNADTRSLIGKMVLALGTLERWLGRPVLDEALAEFVRVSRGSPSTIADFERVASEVSGQDLSWFFDQAFRSAAAFDYGVERLASEPQADGSYLTTVVARRNGDATFTGRSAARVGRFESGRGLLLRITAADGAIVTGHWDGRDREKIFTVQTPSPAVSAELDPDRTILLDVRRTNNSVTRDPRGAAAAIRWGARYMNWVANAMLRYAFLI
jgi:hypothetical protein